MKLPLILGHTSSNEPFTADLSQMPHLFVCFTQSKQLTAFMETICSQLALFKEKKQAVFAIAVNNYNSAAIIPVIEPDRLFLHFNTNSKEENNEMSRRLFMQRIFKEYKKRMAKLNKGEISLKQDDAAHFPPLIIFSDNIPDLVITGSKKATGLNFVRLLVFGPQVAIHCIMASAASYGNLLKQLMHIHPSVKTNLEKNNITIPATINKALGAELIISAEGLLFFKQRNNIQYSKFYP